MPTNKLTVSLAVLVICLAGFVLWKQFSGRKVNLRPSAAVGEVIAEEVGRLLAGKGNVLLAARAPSDDGPSANAERIAAFQAAMRSHPSPKLTATEWLPVPPRGTMDLGGVSEGELVALLDKHPDVNAVVLFAGLPPVSASLSEKLAARSVKLIAMCGYGRAVRRWLESGALTMVVVPRFDDPPADAPAPKTAKDWFDREFLLVTPGTVSQLPY